ncbi:MAG: radical SAM protein [Clostridia bacterium]|nr:radical SAM protein [Clostridia bacterium]
MKNQRIIAISAGQYTHKKGTDPIKEHIRYLNYGLLGLATVLHDRLGLDVTVAQADSDTPGMLIERLSKRQVHIEEYDCVLLSIPSFYSIEWCADFCKIIKEEYGKAIIAGGRWVVDNNTEWVKRKIKHIDTVIEGFGEKRLAELFCPERAETVAEGALQCFDHLNYELLIDHKLYQPSIEISRGCGAGCLFCADRSGKRLQNTPVESVIAEMEYLDRIYGDYSLYLEAPHFHFAKPWCEKLLAAVRKREKIIPWRCTTRVESVPIDMIGTLAATGLKIIDIGLESASPIQLKRMNKTKNPEGYLDRVVKILEECKRHNVWIKLNVLLYAGETKETIAQTAEWLAEYKHLIKGISVSTLVYYKGAGRVEDLIAEGAAIPLGEDPEEKGYTDLDLSAEISAAEAKKYAVLLSQNMMDQRDYYDIKSLSYFERGYTYEHFLSDLQKCDPALLPFSSNG